MKKQDDRPGFMTFLIILLSIYVLVALTVETFFKLNQETVELLYIIDNVICIIFLWDFFYRLYKAKNKLVFLKWGWIDFISSIPTIGFLRVGRVFRLFRLVKMLRAFRSTKILLDYVFHNRVKGTFTAVALIAILMIMFSSIAILNFENHPDSNINSAGDALWWSFVTITTVGYGDKFPVTAEGRIVASLLMTTGVGLFGTFTGFLANWFMEDKNK